MRVVILGATGMLGHKLWQRLPRRFPDTWAFMRGRRDDPRRHGIAERGQVVEGIDASDFSALFGALERLRPQAVLNCIGVTKRHEPAGDPAPSIALNALLPHRLAAWGAMHGARVISFSTDCVFAGRRGGYTENDLPDAEDLYGRTKALGEARTGAALTLRSSFIGRELTGGTELLEWFLAQQGRTIRGFRQALYSGVSTIYLADLVADILASHPHLSGLYNLAGETVSKYALLCLARDKFGVAVDIEPEDNYACKRNLDGARLDQALGRKPPPWQAMMAELAADATPYAKWRELEAADGT